MEENQETNTQVTDPNTQPGGQSYEHMRALQTKTANELNEVKAKLASLESARTSPPPATNTSQNTNEVGQGGAQFDWQSQEFFTESGDINPSLVSAMQSIGAPADLISQIGQTHREAVSIVQERAQENIIKEVGSMDNYKALLDHAKATKSEAEVTSISQMLNNRTTSLYAIKGLKEDYLNSGGSFESQENTTPPPGANEPKNIPESHGTKGSASPLKPGSPEALKEISEAFASGDPERVAAVEARMRAYKF